MRDGVSLSFTTELQVQDGLLSWFGTFVNNETKTFGLLELVYIVLTLMEGDC